MTLLYDRIRAQGTRPPVWCALLAERDGFDPYGLPLMLDTAAIVDVTAATELVFYRSRQEKWRLPIDFARLHAPPAAVTWCETRPPSGIRSEIFGDFNVARGGPLAWGVLLVTTRADDARARLGPLAELHRLATIRKARYLIDTSLYIEGTDDGAIRGPITSWSVALDRHGRVLSSRFGAVTHPEGTTPPQDVSARFAPMTFPTWYALAALARGAATLRPVEPTPDELFTALRRKAPLPRAHHVLDLPPPAKACA